MFPTNASPVFIPMPISILGFPSSIHFLRSLATSFSISYPHFTAFSTWFLSCTGSPNIAITASPINLLITPLYFVIIGSIAEKYSFKMFDTSSADILSDIDVKPLMSANNIVTSARLPPSFTLSMSLTTFCITSFEIYLPIAFFIFSLFLPSSMNLYE